ncbi:hypothetical protein [Thioclava atlantica]|uniref:Uncharacterized protein n=1 Tax=Thioclava atlantica TaxID=1317124 RepID=A0A085TTA4_9RHOB|nr:hypothetical protein [Thioclava atlantica]KFE33951.1 hypothetical protein DW2_15835 [Thioclava atlantica]
MPDAELAPRGSPPPEFDTFLMKVGRINYAWTNTESLLIHLIAGLSGTDKDAAIIIHLTLNTTRARLDLVERLAKRDACPLPDEARARILAVSGRMKKVSGLRNHFNHCLYAFDAAGGPVRAIEMRIADRKSGLRIGEESVLDRATLDEMDVSLGELQDINAEIWGIIRAFDLPA